MSHTIRVLRSPTPIIVIALCYMEVPTKHAVVVVAKVAHVFVYTIEIVNEVLRFK
jgi:hypothetical protein